MSLARLLFVAIALAGCGGSQRGATDSDWTGEPDTKTHRVRDVETLNVAPEPIEKPATATLGVRHDLMLSAGPHESRCNCLSVEVGRPSDPQFFWSGGTPDVAIDALTIAVGARGIPCPGGDPDDRRRRPSISAVEHEGDDVFVEIEDLTEGRPLASGAIIPTPGPKGGIFVYPRKANGVYAGGPGHDGRFPHAPGVGRCRVR